MPKTNKEARSSTKREKSKEMKTIPWLVRDVWSESFPCPFFLSHSQTWQFGDVWLEMFGLRLRFQLERLGFLSDRLERGIGIREAEREIERLEPPS